MTKSCKGRIDKELKERIEDFKNALEGKYPNEEEFEDFLEWLNCYALAYDDDPYYRAKRLELSYGGPQDYFLFFYDQEGGRYRIEYHFLDWFDGAERVLEGDDFEIMKEVFENYLHWEKECA